MLLQPLAELEMLRSLVRCGTPHFDDDTAEISNVGLHSGFLDAFGQLIPQFTLPVDILEGLLKLVEEVDSSPGDEGVGWVVRWYPTAYCSPPG